MRLRPRFGTPEIISGHPRHSSFAPTVGFFVAGYRPRLRPYIEEVFSRCFFLDLSPTTDRPAVFPVFRAKKVEKSNILKKRRAVVPRQPRVFPKMCPPSPGSPGRRVMAGESTTATPRYREETTRVISGSSYRVRRAIRRRGPPLPSSPNRRDSRWNVRRNRVANQTLVRLFRGHG